MPRIRVACMSQGLLRLSSKACSRRRKSLIFEDTYMLCTSSDVDSKMGSMHLPPHGDRPPIDCDGWSLAACILGISIMLWHSRANNLNIKEQMIYDPEVVGLVGGTEVSCLPDKGAACNFMSLQHAKRHGIPVTPSQSDNKITRLGNGKVVKIAGHATLPFSYKGEAESYQLEFVVLPRCIKDVILGSPFLRLTKLFEHHAHRIVRKLRTISGARACYTASQERVVGMLDGELVHALPDTGSDVMLVSET